MKQKTPTAVFVLSISMICFGDAFRTFHGADGRTIEACLKTYDSQSDIVTFKLKNKSIKKVKASIFSEQDQAYIHDWYMADAISSGTMVDLSAKKITIDSGRTLEGHNEWKPSSSSIRFRDMNYEVVLENKSGQTLNNVKVEYCIYHQCSIDEVRYTYREGTFQVPRRIESNVISGIWNIPVFNDNQKLEKITKAIHLRRGEVYKQYPGGGKISHTRELEDELLGLRVRLYVPLKSGKEVMKEYSFPSDLIRKTNWEFSTNNISSEVPILPRPEQELILQNFGKITEEMSKDEVVRLLGYPPYGELDSDIWIWQFNSKENTEYLEVYYISFRDDVVDRIRSYEIERPCKKSEEH